MPKYTVYLMVPSIQWPAVEADDEMAAVLQVQGGAGFDVVTEGLHDTHYVLAAVEEEEEEKEPLYSTFITNQEILEWDFTEEGATIHAALVDEAYARWLDRDKEEAQQHAGAWHGHVEAAEHGYYVWLEAENDEVED